MADFTAISFAPFLLEGINLLAAQMFINHGNLHLRVFNERCTDRKFFTVRNSQHIKFQICICFGMKQLHIKNIALLYTVLLSTGFYNRICFHKNTSLPNQGFSFTKSRVQKLGNKPCAVNPL